MAKAKGSITLFSLVSLLLVTAAIFALLEGTRLQELRRFAKLQTQSTLESVFSNYNTCLWSEYRILGTNQTKMQPILEQTAKGRVGKGMNLLQLAPEEIEVTGYTLLTDANGAVFVKSVANYMQENWVYELAKEVYSQYEALKQLMNSTPVEDQNIDKALEEIESQEAMSTRKVRDISGVKVTELLNSAKQWMEMGILELFIQDTQLLSEQEQDFSNGVLKRKLQKGTNRFEEDVSWTDRLILQQYLCTYMSCFTGEQDGRALTYELEYILGGAERDTDNLKIVAAKILAIREAANFIYLVSDAEKMAQAESMAMLLGGTSLNPAVIEVIRLGIVTAWALAESILDVRALFQGKKISLIKNQENWTSDLESIGEIGISFWVAEESEYGLSYQDYLAILLFFEDNETLAMRTMNLQEATIRNRYGEPDFGIDSLITRAQVKIRYTYQPVFPFLRVIDAEKRWAYEISAEAEYGYD